MYRRNEIQAHSIDSILQHHSLFVGVGAAHLPGKRGVIELLRQQGYHLRPIGMPDHDASQRDDIDKVKVPVKFAEYTSDDGYFSVMLPGQFYKRADSRSGDSWQYADMSNGAYYMITRVSTHSHMFGQNNDMVLKKIDSLLYENIPGKILRKTSINRNGYPGYDITNRTRRGDIQRYNIFVTPFEVLVFKISGNGTYADGKEGDQFFNSIRIRRNEYPGWNAFQPAKGGFSVAFPQQPFTDRNKTGFDGISRWEYEADDSATGNAYLIWKKTIQNYRFLEEDSFALGLAVESFGLSDDIEKRISLQLDHFKGAACIDATYSLKDGGFLRAKFLMKGPDYYLLAARSKKWGQTFSEFFNSFEFRPYQYSGFTNYCDSFINVKVTTPVVPDIDATVRKIVERANSEEFLNAVSDNNVYWPRNKTALFQDDSTGEAVYVSVQTYPKYYYPSDSAYFWKEETNEKKMRDDFIVRSKQPFHLNDSLYGLRYVFSDTNSSNLIHNWIFLKNNRLYRVISLRDSSAPESTFIDQFYATARPLDQKSGEAVFTNKLKLFFDDFYSHDSAISKKAKDAIPNVYFGPAGVPMLLQAIETLPYNDKDYLSTKTRLINELGYINDTVAINTVVTGLRHIYEKVNDTSTFQNAVLKALAHHRTDTAYRLLKTLLLQDPPVFDNESDYNYLFEDLQDSLKLARTLFPGLLQLSGVDDYKENIRSLLTLLVDSNYLSATDYESYFNQLYFDAKIQLKKQMGRDEKQMQHKSDDNADDNLFDREHTPDAYTELQEYAILLAPFYHSNKSLPGFFDKLLKSQDASLRLSTTVLLLKNHIPVADSTILSLAANDETRSELFDKLEKIGQSAKFPTRYNNQVDLTRSQLYHRQGQNHPFAMEWVDKKWVQYKTHKGFAHLFRYKLNKDDDWMIAVAGLQPADPKLTSSDDDFVYLTGKKIKSGEPEAKQFNDQLQKLLFGKHKSASSFYLDNDYYPGRGDDDD